MCMVGFNYKRQTAVKMFLWENVCSYAGTTFISHLYCVGYRL